MNGQSSSRVAPSPDPILSAGRMLPIDRPCSEFQNGVLNLSLGASSMKSNFKVGLGMLFGFGLGAAAVAELHAQAKPPAYVM